VHKLQAQQRPVQQRPVRKLLGAIVAAALFLPDTGYTLGLGEIEINSALNQKLNADIELLSATPEDVETLIVKLASRKEFTRAGLDRPYLLNDLRFTSVEINGSPYIKVSSGSPIREPFLNFLVEIDWPNGRLLREYTVLLDPPVFMTQSISTVANIAPTNVTSASNNSGFRPASGGSNNVVPVVTPAASVLSRPASTAQVVQDPSLAQAPVVQAQAGTSQISRTPSPTFLQQAQQQSVINQPAGSYKIKTGDTAWSLANAMRPDQSVTVTQMMVAMLRENRESFINGNINGLKRGYILRVPDYDQITSLSHADAMVLVREQAALWRQYQQSQAGGQPVSQMRADDDGVASDMAEGSAAGRDAGSEDDAHLEIVSAGSGSSATSGKDPVEMTAQELRAELSLARERVETERVEKEALQQRVDALQQNVEKMKGILAIEDAELAQVQALNEPAKGEVVQEEKVDESVMEDRVVNAVDEADALDAIDEAAALATLEPDAAAEHAEEGVLFVDETQDESVAEMPEQVASTTDDFVEAEPQIENPESADLLTQVLNNPMLLAASGGGLLLFAALIGLIIKRRKEAAEESTAVTPIATRSDLDDLENLADDIASEVDESEKVEQASVVDEDIIDDADSTATMTQDSAEEPVIAEPEASDEIAEEEPRDDVIAEADVYLAYGIYQQAEELLTQAIADNPERDDYRVKLAETHYASKNTDAFVDIARDIKQRVNNDASPVWKKVLGMGQDLCADNPLFQSAIVGGLAAGSLSADFPEMDFDLDLTNTGLDEISDAMPNAMLDKSSDLDSSMDEERQEEALRELPKLELDAEAVSSVDELEFDLSDVGAVEDSTDIEEEFSLDIDASELDIDIKDEIVAETDGIDLTDDIEADVYEKPLDLTDMDLTGIDIGLDEVADDVSVAAVDDVEIDFDVDVDTDSETMLADENITIDLTEEAKLLDIDLSEKAGGEEIESTAIEAEPIEVKLGASDDPGEDEDDFDLSKLDDVDEISTKLDLARAYLDMGDHEGSKGILEEVLADGDDEQKREASELLKAMVNC